MDYTDDSSSEGSDSVCDELDDVVVLGKRLKYMNIKWKFPQTTQCPLDTCRISCSSRNVAIIHFLNTHADTTTICIACDTLLSMGEIEKHYTVYHPTKALPELKHVKSRKSEPIKEDTVENDLDTDDEEDDLITLNGCGQVTQWRFPDTKICPVQNCRLLFGIRSDAMHHYKKRHAKVSILCPICEKPIISHKPSDFMRHFLRIHPNNETPFVFGARAKVTGKKTKKRNKQRPKRCQGTEIESEIDHNMLYEAVDDVITLKGFGKITKWRFPKYTTNCPVLGCGLAFPTRSDAINHYKNQHADHFTLCSICVKPISSSKLSMKWHYKNVHPNSYIPFELDENETSNEIQNSKNDAVMVESQKDQIKETTDKQDLSVNDSRSGLESSKDNRSTCNVCGISIKDTCNLKRHLKEMHSSTRILCPLVDCDFVAKRMYKLHQHWDKVHSHLRFPEMRDQNLYETTVSTISTAENTNDYKKPEATNKCKDCDYKAKTLFALYRHRRKEHKITDEGKETKINGSCESSPDVTLQSHDVLKDKDDSREERKNSVIKTASLNRAPKKHSTESLIHQTKRLKTMIPDYYSKSSEDDTRTLQSIVDDQKRRKTESTRSTEGDNLATQEQKKIAERNNKGQSSHSMVTIYVSDSDEE